MNRVYFDTNIFEGIVKKEIDISIDELNNFTNIIYYISTAHVEEYFIAIRNDAENKFTKYNNDRKLLMSSLKSKGILNPSITRIVNKPEKFDDCLSRVKKYDTTNRMVENGSGIHQEQDKYFKDLLSKNPNIQNYSNLASKEIWDRNEVKYILSRVQDYVKMHNAVIFSELEREYGSNIALKITPLKEISIFEIKKGCFKEICIQHSINVGTIKIKRT